MRHSLLNTLFILMLPVISGCTGIPDGIKPVDGFEINRYLGKWYEIARLDHSFERNLNHVSADYSLRDDGGVKVINRGYYKDTGQWKEAEGKAYFVKAPDEAHLKVSFFGPFYGSYIVFELDKDNYQYAFVSSYNTSYLWLLARTPTLSKEITERFIKKSQALGFNTDHLIFVEHKTTGSN